MIFVDTTLGKSFEQFAYTSRDNNVEYASADTKLGDTDGSPFDIPLIGGKI